MSQQWNKDVDNYFNFDISNLDETSPHFPNILQLRIKTLQVTKLLQKSILNTDGSPIFKHPNLIKNLVIVSSNSDKTKIISPNNLELLLGICAKNLKHLRLDFSASVCTYQLSPDQIYNFANLTNLEICLERQNLFSADLSTTTNNMLHQLENSFIPKLSSFKVNLNFSGHFQTAKHSFHLQVFKLLVKHGRSLETLQLNLDKGPILNPDFDFLQSNELEILNKMNRLKFFQLNLRPTGQMAYGFWQDLICSQKNLVEVKMETRFDVDQPLNDVPTAMTRNLVSNNESTLVSLNIQSLSLLVDGSPFDLSVFQNCTRLESLVLRRNTESSIINNSQAPHLENFNTLPDSIAMLELHYFKILSNELVQVFSDPVRFQKLEKVVLSYCGEVEEFGVTGRVLDRILTVNRPSFKDIFIFRGINSNDFEGRENNVQEIMSNLDIGCGFW